jgi:subtilisin family serine protease
MRNNSFFILFILLQFLTALTTAQDASQNWFNSDPDKDHFAGVSTDLAYEKLLNEKVGNVVIVAVIDGGTDTEHPDLRDHIWINPGETAGNGIDDDNNGYVDDIHGWNFIGGATDDVRYENLEATRIYKKYKPVFDNKNHTPGSDEKALKKTYQEAKEKVEKELKEAKSGLEVYSKLKKQLDELKAAMGTEEFTADEVNDFKTADEEFNKLKTGIAGAMKNGVSFNEIYDEVEEGYNHFNSQVRYQLNPEYDARKIVGDNPEDYSQKIYGNNHVKGPEAMHGTHVAGIIAAVRNNNEGMNGVADKVSIMVLRVVPDGDERDKDIANAIRYAADNGAKVINMSFGKPFSPGKKYVDEAVKYAASKDVLMVHGAGNEAQNIDKKKNYPNPLYADKSGREPAWIEVGAMSSSGDAANFSNYGKKQVDVFAPGVSIYSTIPDGKYKNLDGTSMASPVVAGIATLLRSYYPQLTAVQVRKIIMDSAIKVPFKTKRPGSKKKVKYSSLAATGGFANAYRALKMADSMR